MSLFYVHYDLFSFTTFTITLNKKIIRDFNFFIFKLVNIIPLQITWMVNSVFLIRFSIVGFISYVRDLIFQKINLRKVSGYRLIEDLWCHIYSSFTLVNIFAYFFFRSLESKQTIYMPNKNIHYTKNIKNYFLF